MADDLVREARDALEASANGWKVAREKALECFKFVAGEDHWPSEVRASREAQQRPCLTVNKLPKFLAQVTGQYRMSNMAIRVIPVDDKADVGLARIFSGMLRAIQHESSAQVAFRTALQQSACGGWGWFRVVREYETEDAWDQTVRVRPVHNVFSVYSDPRSFSFDLSDCQYVVVSDEIPEEEFKRKYPKAATGAEVDSGWGDKKIKWHNGADKTVRVAEYWARRPVTRRLLLVGIPGDDTTLETVEWPKKGEEQEQLLFTLESTGFQVLREREAKGTKIVHSLVSGADVLEGEEDHPGRYFPQIPVFGEELVFDGERRLWGVVTHALDPQRIYNFQWTSAVETVALQPKAPYLLTPRQLNNGEFDNSSYWNAINRGIPYVLWNPDPQAPVPQRQMPPTIPTGALELCDRASYDLMETTGIYQSSLGEKSNEKSGAAIEARARQGNMAVAAWPDNLRLAMEHAGRVILDLIPTVYDTPRMVKMLGENLTDQERIQIDLSRTDASRGRYDTLVTVGPSWESRRQETQQGTIEIMQMLPPELAAPMVPVLLKYTDNPAAAEMSDILQQQIQQAQMMGAMGPVDPSGMAQPPGGGPQGPGGSLPGM